jgi:hypothetical protein
MMDRHLAMLLPNSNLEEHWISIGFWFSSVSDGVLLSLCQEAFEVIVAQMLSVFSLAGFYQTSK